MGFYIGAELGYYEGDQQNSDISVSHRPSHQHI